MKMSNRPVYDDDALINRSCLMSVPLEIVRSRTRGISTAALLVLLVINPLAALSAETELPAEVASSTDTSAELPEEAPDWLQQAEKVIERRELATLLQHPERLPEQFVVRSGRWSTPEEAERDVENLASQLLRHKCDWLFAGKYPQFAIAAAHPQGRELREQAYQAQEVVTLLDDLHSPMYRESWLVNASASQLARLTPVIQQETGRTRFRDLLLVLGIFTLNCGGIAWLLNRRTA